MKNITISIIPQDTFVCIGEIDTTQVVYIEGTFEKYAIFVNRLEIRVEVQDNVFVLECLCKLINELLKLPTIVFNPVIQFGIGTYDWIKQQERLVVETLSTHDMQKVCEEYIIFEYGRLPREIFELSPPKLTGRALSVVDQIPSSRRMRRRHTSPTLRNSIPRPVPVRRSVSPPRRKEEEEEKEEGVFKFSL